MWRNNFECVVYEHECTYIECALLSMTVPYLGDAPEETLSVDISKFEAWS